MKKTLYIFLIILLIPGCLEILFGSGIFGDLHQISLVSYCIKSGYFTYSVPVIILLMIIIKIVLKKKWF